MLMMVSLQASPTAVPMASRPITRLTRILPPYMIGWKHSAASLDHDLPVHEGMPRAMIREHAGDAECARITLSRSHVGGVPHRGVGRGGVGLGAGNLAVHPGDDCSDRDPDRIGVESKVTDGYEHVCRVDERD